MIDRGRVLSFIPASYNIDINSISNTLREMIRVKQNLSTLKIRKQPSGLVSIVDSPHKNIRTVSGTLEPSALVDDLVALVDDTEEKCGTKRLLSDLPSLNLNKQGAGLRIAEGSKIVPIECQINSGDNNAHVNYTNYSLSFDPESPLAIKNFMYEGEFYLQEILLRFTSVVIPQGSKILSAKISFHAHSNSGGSVISQIATEYSDDAEPYTDYLEMVFRGYVNIPLLWVVPPLTPGSWYDTVDISTQIQEVVNRVGWKSGNAMSFWLMSDWYEIVEKGFTAYKDDPDNAPKLIIRYI